MGSSGGGGGVAAAFDHAAYKGYMVVLVKKSVSYLLSELSNFSIIFNYELKLIHLIYEVNLFLSVFFLKGCPSYALNLPSFACTAKAVVRNQDKFQHCSHLCLPGSLVGIVCLGSYINVIELA